MIRIDDSLLEEIGLISLPENERRELLAQIYRRLEENVGLRLAQQMSEEQLVEFEKFVDGDTEYVQNYLNANRPGWQQSEAYTQTLAGAKKAAEQAGREVSEDAVKAEFAALSWLEINFPDYKKVVAEELDKLKVEIKKDADKIIEAVSTAQQQDMPPQSQPMDKETEQPSVSAMDQTQPDNYDDQPPLAA